MFGEFHGVILFGVEVKRAEIVAWLKFFEYFLPFFVFDLGFDS